MSGKVILKNNVECFYNTKLDNIFQAINNRQLINSTLSENTINYYEDYTGTGKYKYEIRKEYCNFIYDTINKNSGLQYKSMIICIYNAFRDQATLYKTQYILCVDAIPEKLFEVFKSYEKLIAFI